MAAENLTLSPAATSRTNVFFCKPGAIKQTQHIEKEATVFQVQFKQSKQMKVKTKVETIDHVKPEDISKSARWKYSLGLRVVKKTR